MNTAGRFLLFVIVAALLTSCGDDSSPTNVGGDTDPVAPTANFNFVPNASNPLTIVFTDTSTPGTAPITAWNWDFGDGATSTIQNPSHTYAEAGTYNTTLSVTTSVASNAKTTSVSPSIIAVPPTANFLPSVRGGETPVVIQFQDTSLPGSGPILAWSWDFGDGISSTEQNPTHTFRTGPGNTTEPQFFTVELRVTTAAGTDTKTEENLVEAYEMVYSSNTQSGIPQTATYVEPVGEGQKAETAFGQLATFRPNIEQANIVSWSQTSARDDCEGVGIPYFAPPADPVPAMQTSIPRVSDIDYYWEIGRAHV